MTARAVERDTAADNLAIPGESGSDSDDLTYGSRRVTLVGQKRRRRSNRQSMQLQQQPLLPESTALALDADFAPLTDLKGAAAADVVGRRIRCWYEDGQGGSLKPALGVVTYHCEQGRMHVAYDGDEAEGW